MGFGWMNGSPEFGDLFSPALEHLLGPRRAPSDRLEDRHNDIARSAQAMYEEAFFHLLGNLQRQSGLTDLALAGGCAMNSVANGSAVLAANACDTTCQSYLINGKGLLTWTDYLSRHAQMGT